MSEARTPVPLNDIGDLLPFLNNLKDKRFWNTLAHQRDDGILVLIPLIGIRLEVEFLVERVKYSLFTGDESVLDDYPALFDLLEQHSA